jgi:hypothetical protein
MPLDSMPVSDIRVSNLTVLDTLVARKRTVAAQVEANVLIADSVIVDTLVVDGFPAESLSRLPVETSGLLIGDGSVTTPVSVDGTPTQFLLSLQNNVLLSVMSPWVGAFGGETDEVDSMIFAAPTFTPPTTLGHVVAKFWGMSFGTVGVSGGIMKLQATALDGVTILGESQSITLPLVSAGLDPFVGAFDIVFNPPLDPETRFKIRSSVITAEPEGGLSATWAFLAQSS